MPFMSRYKLSNLRHTNIVHTDGVKKRTQTDVVDDHSCGQQLM